MILIPSLSSLDPPHWETAFVQPPLCIGTTDLAHRPFQFQKVSRYGRSAFGSALYGRPKTIAIQVPYKAPSKIAKGSARQTNSRIFLLEGPQLMDDSGCEVRARRHSFGSGNTKVKAI